MQRTDGKDRAYGCSFALETSEITPRMVTLRQRKRARSLQVGIPDDACEHKLEGSQKVYEFQPSNYEELLAFNGVGPATVRGLALIAEVVYGEKPSWKDPVKCSFAYGGKDGVPYPVNRKAMEESVQMLRQAVEESRIGDKEKMRSLCSLRRFVPEDRDNKSC